MASPIGNFPAVAVTPIQSIKSKIMFLHDWWLVKSHHNRLAVGGFAYKGECGLRGFCSAAISKRLSTNTLVTIDGITIMMSGYINKSKTQENGFSFKVCNHFLLGFPYYWETYGGRCFGEDSGHMAAPYETCIFDELKSCSKITSTLDDLPVTKVRDWFVSCGGDSNSRLLIESILDDVLRKTGEVTTNGGGDSNFGGLRVKESGGGGLKMPVVEIEETQGRTAVDDGGSTEVVANGMKPKAISIRRGVSTRSMSRQIKEN